MALIGRALRCLPAIRTSAVVLSQAVNTQRQFVPKRNLTEKSIADLESVPESVRKIYFKLQIYQQYGLYVDDLYDETADVKEALRRLPLQVQDERAFRLQRALHHSMCKTVLPKEEWTSWEDNQANGRYLEPYLEEVVKEREERERWDSL